MGGMSPLSMLSLFVSPLLSPPSPLSLSLLMCSARSLALSPSLSLSTCRFLSLAFDPFPFASSALVLPLSFFFLSFHVSPLLSLSLSCSSPILCSVLLILYISHSTSRVSLLLSPPATQRARGHVGHQRAQRDDSPQQRNTE